MNRCLICAKQNADNDEYHAKCLAKLFGYKRPPVLEYSLDGLSELSTHSIIPMKVMPGVRVKFSIDSIRQKNSNSLKIAGVSGNFILKPPSKRWPDLAVNENEHCTTLMAEAAGIETVPCGLIRLKSGELALITQRTDRDKKWNKIAIEDMGQLSRHSSDERYAGSYEQVAELIKKYTENPMFDVMRFFELIVFCYLTGNSDMHLKNISLINDPVIGWKLSAATELMSTRLIIPGKLDPKELALTIGGSNRNLKRNSFFEFGKKIGLNRKQILNTIDKLLSKSLQMEDVILSGFLPDEKKEKFIELLQQRRNVLDWEY